MSSSGDDESLQEDREEEEKSDDDSRLPDSVTSEPAAAAAPSEPVRLFPLRKGSRPYLPTETKTQCALASMAKYYQLLDRRGAMHKKNARAKRRKLRDILVSSGNASMVNPAVESSSESESDSADESEWQRNTVDWQALAHNSQQAKECLFGIIPVQETSSLVGWATHHTHDGSAVTVRAPAAHRAQDEDVQVMNGNEVQEMPATQQNHVHEDSATVRQAHQQQSNAGAAPDHQGDNPLLFLPNTPLPPSHLKYLAKMAKGYAEQPVVTQYRWHSRTYLASSDTSDDEDRKSKPKYNQNRRAWQQWEYDDNDETYKAARELLKKRKRRVTLHVPGAAEEQRKVKSHLYETLDDTALVALGMAWEEAITASLLPLARQHVARCRKLEETAKDTNSITTEPDMDAFHQWTLPPEQAIWKLAQEEVATPGIPSARPPTRIHRPFESIARRRDHGESREQQAVLEWCQNHNLDPAFVQNNMDVYRTCIPCAPVMGQSTPPAREKDRRRSKLRRKRIRLENNAAAPDLDNPSSDESNGVNEASGMGFV